MKIGICTRTHDNWLEEFKNACPALGLEFRLIQIGRDDWAEQLQGLDAFVWRLIMGDASCMAEAHTKIPLIEQMGIPCFPNTKMLWLFDDKIRESLFLRQHGYPTPATSIFFDEAPARAHADQATYPLIVKSHCGAASVGVMMLPTPREAHRLLDRIFQPDSLWSRALARCYTTPRLKKGDLLLSLNHHYRDSRPRYAYFQQFITTDCDWRITTLGKNLVSLFMRKNRPDDFRASGSGLWEKVETADVPTEACDLALKISNTHGFTCMTYDFMRAEEGWVIGELSYSFLLNRIYTDTLFLREEHGYVACDPIPVGVMHLCSLLDLPLPKASAVAQSAHGR